MRRGKFFASSEHPPSQSLTQPRASASRDMRPNSFRVIAERHNEMTHSQPRKRFRHSRNARPLQKTSLLLAQNVLCREQPPITNSLRRQPHPFGFTHSPRELLLRKTSPTSCGSVVEHCNPPAPITHKREQISFIAEHCNSVPARTSHNSIKRQPAILRERHEHRTCCTSCRKLLRERRNIQPRKLLQGRGEQGFSVDCTSCMWFGHGVWDKTCAAASVLSQHKTCVPAEHET